jgi:hypothetical protein
MNRVPGRAFATLALLAIISPVLNAQMRPASGAAPAQSQGDARPRVLAVGEKIQVSWSGVWYAATVLELGEGTYKIRYDGWSSDWDEWVGPGRIRLANGGAVAAPPARARATTPAPQPQPARPATAATPTAGTKAAPTTQPAPAGPSTPAAKPPTPKILSTSPVGRYGCRTWDYGQVNRVGEFVLRANGEYEDLFYKGKGRYSYTASTRRVTFTSGPQKTSAKITFNPEGHAGKGHIVFDYGGARLDCYREALK